MKPHEEHPAPWTVHWDGYARCYRLTDDSGDISQWDAAEAYNSLAKYAHELEGRTNVTETPKLTTCPDCHRFMPKGLVLCTTCQDNRKVAERADDLHAKNKQLAKEVNRALCQRDYALGVCILLVALNILSLVIR